MSRQYLGQNFLIDESILEKIASLFKPPGEFGEIGPGHGELTKYLSKKYSDFTVFEKDKNLVPLHKTLKNYRVVEGDFLDWDFNLQNKQIENFSFIGNLPYEAGTAIVKRICERPSQVVHFLFLLQKEVVERLCAKPHTRDFGSLSVLVQGQFDVEALDIVRPEAFNPAPQVMSQLVGGFRRENGAHPVSSKYNQFVQSCFLHKRKTFRNAIKSKFSKEKIDEVFQDFDLKPTARAEEISVDLWPALFKAFQDG
ncbi:MAG: ribosomal RNA small subunit methyltransferase A [Deltaproteobacteria bacterium]|nr:ribosomal RNA small subunit methyltransferase A [Deltaproteobacteria bacterium]